MKRKILFDLRDEDVNELYELLSGASKLCNVLWAYECSLKYVELFEELRDDVRVRQARDASYDWAKGKIKMPLARHLILAAHAAAKESGNPVAEAAARATAHAASAVHSERHAIGLAYYGLTALALLYGKDSEEVSKEKQRLFETACDFVAKDGTFGDDWAHFLLVKNKK